MILTHLFLTGALGALPTPAGDGTACTATTKACSADKKDIVATALGAGSFKTLAAALDAAGLVGTLQGDGPFTVFAPTDEAFAKLPKGTLESLLKPESRPQLVEILKQHVVSGRVMADQVVKLAGAESLTGQRLSILVEEGNVRVAGARVTKTDVACTNGVIHVIDAVLLPSTKNLVELAQGAGTFQTLLAAAQAAGLAETLATGGTFTLLAPTDEAFAKLPQGTLDSLLKPENKEALAGILKAHVLPGRVFSDQVATLSRAKALSGDELAIAVRAGQVSIAGANVLKTDLQARNGVVHVLDAVIVPR
jgi:uncharacterized surface protein with fasciclin (FAS1) repeats